jgi:hypothetical protein
MDANFSAAVVQAAIDATGQAHPTRGRTCGDRKTAVPILAADSHQNKSITNSPTHGYPLSVAIDSAVDDHSAIAVAIE